MIGDYMAFLSAFRFFIINFAHNIRIKLIFNSNYYNKNQKMKKFFSYFMIAMCLLGTSVVTSCGSDDDDNGSLKDLPYEADAALYELVGNHIDKIAYIELTSAGNYFIEHKSMVKSKAATMNVNDVEIPLPFTTADKNTTRAIQDNFEYGIFVKNDDGSYTLKDRSNDILTIKSEGSNNYTITLGGNNYTATRINRNSSLSGIGQICRSWKMSNVYVKWNQSLIGGINANFEEEASNYNELMKKLEKRTGFSFGSSVQNFDYVSFNNTGSYIVKTDNSIDRDYWNWTNNKLYFSKSPELGFDVTFDGSTLKLDYKMSIDMGAAGNATLEIGYEFYERLF